MGPVDFDAVIPGLLAPHSRSDEVVAELVHLLQLQGP